MESANRMFSSAIAHFFHLVTPLLPHFTQRQVSLKHPQSCATSGDLGEAGGRHKIEWLLV